MAPPASGTARRATAAPQPRPSTRRPPLRVLEPQPRRSTRRRLSRRGHLWFATLLVVASLLVVVVGDTMVAQGQIRLADLQNQTAAQQTSQKTMQVVVAQLTASDRIVQEALALGEVAPPSVLDLPEVPLNVPLPVPDTAPQAATSATTAATSG